MCNSKKQYMKRTLIIILLFSFKSYSQDFTGKWKIFSYEDEIAYYNKTKDSIFYKNPARKDEAERSEERRVGKECCR